MEPSQTMPDGYPIHRNSIAYGRDARQTLDVCLLHPADGQDADHFWVIYIHGGAWRDPEVDSTSFGPTLNNILGDASVVSNNIAGFASINYRLSPYPSHLSDPSSPSDPSRNVKHPNHIHDVLNALRFLQREYRFGERYLLVGHSCGATLAFQVAMIRRGEGPYKPGYEKPVGILGVEGVYDMVALRDNHKDKKVYQEIIENVFGTDEAWWKACSPVSGDYNKHWPNGRLTVLAQSFDDELVEKDQMLRMKSALTEQYASSMEQERNTSRIDAVRILHGKHDDVWKEGTQLAESIKAALQRLVQMRS